MKSILALATASIVAFFCPAAFAEFDLEQDVIVIPDTHQDKEYRWKVEKDRKDVDAAVTYGTAGPAGLPFRLVISGRPGRDIDKLLVFITDRDLHRYVRIRPWKSADGIYTFDFNPPETASYRFEIVFSTPNGWVSLSKDLKLPSSSAVKDTQAGEELYGVRLKRHPKTFYAGHVSTFIYQLTYKGAPLKDLEEIDGADIQFASWDEKLEDFVYATSNQNTGGPEVPVSVVFLKPGKRAVFAEFRHKGIVRKVDTVVTVYEEPVVAP